MWGYLRVWARGWKRDLGGEPTARAGVEPHHTGRDSDRTSRGWCTRCLLAATPSRRVRGPLCLASEGPRLATASHCRGPSDARRPRTVARKTRSVRAGLGVDVMGWGEPAGPDGYGPNGTEMNLGIARLITACGCVAVDDGSIGLLSCHTRGEAVRPAGKRYGRQRRPARGETGHALPPLPRPAALTAHAAMPRPRCPGLGSGWRSRRR